MRRPNTSCLFLLLFLFWQEAHDPLNNHADKVRVGTKYLCFYVPKRRASYYLHQHSTLSHTRNRVPWSATNLSTQHSFNVALLINDVPPGF